MEGGPGATRNDDDVGDWSKLRRREFIPRELQAEEHRCFGEDAVQGIIISFRSLMFIPFLEKGREGRMKFHSPRVDSGLSHW